MSNYTPGPWKAVHVTVAAQIDVMEIAEVADMRVIPASGGWPTAGAPESDACLIAAAPELLEACRTIVESFDALPPAHPARCSRLHINAARAAIAKATGEAT